MAEKKQVLGQFSKWCQQSDLIYDDLLKDSKELQFSAIRYLESYRVKDKNSGELVRPKAGYLTKVKSHLITELSRLSGKYND